MTVDNLWDYDGDLGVDLSDGTSHLAVHDGTWNAVPRETGDRPSCFTVLPEQVGEYNLTPEQQAQLDEWSAA